MRAEERMTPIKYNIFQLFIFFLCLIKSLTETPSLAKPGCRDTCGNVTLPFPFGIGAGCFLNEWFEVVCINDKHPFLNKAYTLESRGELLNISLDASTLTTNSNNPSYSYIRVCEGKVFEVTNMTTPFFYDSYNKIIVVGCGNVVLFVNDTVKGGCTSSCDQDRIITGCYGIKCCEISLASDFVPPYYLNFTNLGRRTQSCASLFFAEKSWSPTNLTSFIDSYKNLVGVLNIPFILRWTIPELMFPELKMNKNCFLDKYGSYKCSCPFCTEGNPYITNGCQVSFDNPYCVPNSNFRSRTRLVLLVVGGTSLGILFLVITSLLLYKSITKRRKRKLKEKYFKRNGGLLLQQQLLVEENTIDRVRFFTERELDKATDYFNENRVLGRGGQGTVYKGMLDDGKIIAVKKSKLDDKYQVEFINEIVLLSQINHRNVVKLLGCCLETEVPLLVYEFIPNGNLYDLIHNQKDEVLMSWDMRLRIATEIAGALAYLHYATSVPIYHRDIKSSNILLDEKYIAKVSDFGISRNVSIDQTHLTTNVKGTFGYLDPEYFQSNQFTDKSDVYSFGVVLVELLTREKPIPSTANEGESYLGLAGRFLMYMEEDRLDKIADAQILETASREEITRFAKLAQRCLTLDGKKRPTMKEVVVKLESIKLSKSPSPNKSSFQGKGKAKMELVTFSGGVSVSLSANNSVISSSSDAYPLLADTF